jgi:hypothetical protein
VRSNLFRIMYDVIHNLSYEYHRGQLIFVKRELWISHFKIREEMNKITFLTIRHSYIFLIYQTTDYNSIYRLRQQKYLENSH